MRPSLFAVVLLALSPALVVAAVHAPSKGGAEGRVLYMRYCGSCHGVDADGHGPVASVLSRSPADLRSLGERFGRPLDAARVARWVDGREDVAAHGSREMPVWGERFHAPEGGIDPRIRAIVTYLDGIQTR
jgi:mono/diheme cytochrome c family protein